MRKIQMLLTVALLSLCAAVSTAAPVASMAEPDSVAGRFGVRAFYVDCRAEVMTIEALEALADDLSTKGINALVMEWEATFPFDKHATLCNKYAFTPDQVRGFVARCAGLGIDVIPLQNCFGHCEYILRHDRYRELREDQKEVSQVCPLKIEEAAKVFTEIFREVAALHPSKYFHIGADETYLLGNCKECSAAAASEGKSRLFVDYIKAMSRIVIDMGKTPVIWADIILKYPEAVKELPSELIFVDWNYGWEPDRFGKLQNLFEAGLKMWGAPALRSAPDNLYLTQWEKHFGNLTAFVPFARKMGYTGMIETSWSTGGVYGYHFDMSNEIVNMQPIRFVYPTSGFNILLDAYAQAVNTSEPLDAHKFVTEYARTRYGLPAEDARTLWAYFTLPQEMVTIHVDHARDAKGTPLDKVLEECLAMKARFSKLSPNFNREEFDHYGLMLDIRINYLQFKQIEAVYESSSYDRSQAAGLATRLRRVIDDGAQLDKRFTALNKGYLKDGELVELNRFRSEKMKALYSWLENNK